MKLPFECRIGLWGRHFCQQAGVRSEEFDGEVQHGAEMVLLS